jgi:hypothetical protein
VPSSPIGHDAVTTFRVAATDAANHTSTCSSGFAYTQDATAPLLVIDSTPPAFTNDPNPTIAFHGSDANGVSFQCDFTGPSSDSGACTSPYDFGGGSLGDGSYTAHVTAVDGAQNQTQSTDIDFTVDTVAPDTFIDMSPPTFTNDPTPSLTFHATDANLGGVTFTCQVDSDTPVACSSGDGFGPVSDGPHTITVTAKDGANNVDASPASSSFTVDTAAPVATIDSAPSGTTSDNTPTISFHAADDNLSGVTFSCRVDAGPTAACTSPVTFGPLPDGPHTISLVAADQAGNESPPKSASFTISTLQPPGQVTPTSPVLPAVKKKCKKKKHRAASVAKKKCKKKKR